MVSVGFGLQDKTQPTVGIPRALTFYKQAATWMEFFTSLGVSVVLSGPTNKRILEEGINLSVDEACLPVKVYLGHVKQLLREQTDYIFVHRQQDFNAQEVLCTKLWGIPDICRNTFELPDGRKWLELNISPSVDGISEYKAWYKVGRDLAPKPARIKAAYHHATLAQGRYEAWLQAGKPPMQALQLTSSGAVPNDKQTSPSSASQAENRRIRIALLGHAYLVHDEYFGVSLAKMLRHLGARVHTVEELDKELCRSCGREISPALYWTYNREVVGAAGLYLRQGVDGVILVEAFPCGPDALVLDYAMRKLKGRAPIMRLVLDELQALTGIQTRLESFIDVLRVRYEETTDARI
jgi:predicted nucleotide-binding protein (sugar kinase/HSP70/actin superfamily)